MTLEQLRIFVAVAEREHMTRAAEALNLTQSAVSAAIAALEARYATPLFHRVGRRIELTGAGRVFLTEAKAVLARAEAAELALSELAGLRRGRLAIQASQTIASYWLPRHLVAFRRAYPNLELRLTVGNTAQAARAVLDGVAELGFVEGAVDETLLASEPVASDRLVLVVGPDHPWIGWERIAPHDLTRTDWVLREPGSGTRSEFESALQRLGIGPHLLRVALELPSNEAVRAAVEAGAGATAISRMVVEPGLRSGTLSCAGFDLPERPFHVVRHRERYHTQAARALLAVIAENGNTVGNIRSVQSS
jgi:DNA-binding transcriptional LysR family regulator